MSGRYEKYDLYLRAVQDPPAMADFISNVYRDCSGKWPHLLREDFCGTFALSHEWVTRDPRNHAVAVDNSAEPLDFGKNVFLAQMVEEERRRLTIKKEDVNRDAGRAKIDIIAALNFSYCVFKKREALRAYIKNSLSRLKPGGLLVMDVLGGMEIGAEMQTEATFADFHYTWDQVRFNPITREALFHIHFQKEEKRPIKKAFVYDWRMWTVPELRDLCEEAGFKKSHVYWEGYGRLQSGEGPNPSESWVAYVVACK